VTLIAAYGLIYDLFRSLILFFFQELTQFVRNSRKLVHLYLLVRLIHSLCISCLMQRLKMIRCAYG
jgi:hypothetical protein